jgi:hypothetical protein
VSGISDFLKKDLSLKRKPSATAEAATTMTEEPKTGAPKRSMSLPKRAPKERKTSAASSGGRHKQLVGLSIGASELAAAVVVNNGRPKLVKAARRTLPADVVASGEVRDP